MKLTTKLACVKIKAVYSFIMEEKWLGLTSITACKKDCQISQSSMWQFTYLSISLVQTISLVLALATEFTQETSLVEEMRSSLARRDLDRTGS